MKPNLDNFTVTAHALGDLDPPSESLLRLTFGTPEAAAALRAECAEIREVTSHLRSGFAALPTQHLNEGQRLAILARAQSATEALAQIRPTKVMSVRPLRSSTWLATLVTAGIAAAVAALLLVIRPRGGLQPSTPGASPAEVETIAKFKIRPPSPSKPEVRKDRSQQLAGLPTPPLDKPAQTELPDPADSPAFTADIPPTPAAPAVVPPGTPGGPPALPKHPNAQAVVKKDSAPAGAKPTDPPPFVPKPSKPGHGENYAAPKR